MRRAAAILDTSSVDLDDVEVIAPNLLRRLVGAEDLEVAPARKHRRQVAELDPAGERQFLLERDPDPGTRLVVTEQVFSRPGLGRVAVLAIGNSSRITPSS